MSEITESQAAEMSRAEALRVMATADGVPERTMRLAKLMLAGPDITEHDERSVRRPRHTLMAKAAAVALAQMRAEREDEERATRAEFAELGTL